MKQLIFYIPLILFSTQSIAPDFWTPIETPENFQCRSMAVNSLGWLFVGTADGVYRSTENGENLVKVGLNNVIGELTIDSHDNIYTGSNSIYFSTNNGDDWSIISTPSDVECILKNDNILLYGNWGEINKSTDNGEHWTQVLQFISVANSIVENIDGVLFAGITSFFGGGGVYRSINGGDNWEYVGLSDYYIWSLATNSQGVLFAGSVGGDGVGIYSSNNNGETWTELKTDVFVESIVITPDDTIYIGCSNEYATQGGGIPLDQ